MRSMRGGSALFSSSFSREDINRHVCFAVFRGLFFPFDGHKKHVISHVTRHLESSDLRFYFGILVSFFSFFLFPPYMRLLL